MSRAAVGLLVAGLVVLAGPAAADVKPSGRLGTVEMAAQPHAQAATVLFINRCEGGCTIHKGAINDAQSHTSQIPDGSATDYTMSAFAAGDPDWDKLMLCLREVYSPYGVTVTDQQPTAGIAYNEGIVAGVDAELGLNGFLGIAPVTTDCTPYSYVISFTFANAFGAGQSDFLCSVVAQETGHAFGLDHSFEFIDGSSACRDPMSYRNDCGGQRFFRNELAKCGEGVVRQCRCGATQNSHLTLTTVLGPGTPITQPPAVAITTPAANETIGAGARVIATAGAQRGVAKLELWLNGYKWAEAKGAPWGAAGQPETAYPITIPAEVPDSVIDIVVKAKDDIGVTTESAALRVTKGAACQSAETCAKGQRCDDQGRCLWDAPVGAIGATCDYAQYCTSGICASASGAEGDDQRCTQECVATIGDTCPETFECVATGTKSYCFPEGAGEKGCCDSNASGAQSLLLAGGFGFAFLARRRRQTK